MIRRSLLILLAIGTLLLHAFPVHAQQCGSGVPCRTGGKQTIVVNPPGTYWGDFYVEQQSQATQQTRVQVEARDARALEIAVAIAQNRKPGDGILSRFADSALDAVTSTTRTSCSTNGGACSDSANGLNAAIRRHGTETPDSPLAGWNVRRVEMGTGQHVANVLISPDGQRVYYIDNYLGNGVDLVPMDRIGSNQYQPAAGEHFSAAIFTIQAGIGLDPSWRGTDGGVPNDQYYKPIVGKKSTKKTVQSSTSIDPNEVIGATGVGSSRYISGNVPLRYAVFFENDARATASAQEIVITNQLDITKLDLDTFSLGTMTVGDWRVEPPTNTASYSKRVDLRPKQNLLVAINVDLDRVTGLVTWRFSSLDPETQKFVDDPLAGFLLPNKQPPLGEGNVLFTVKPKAGLPTGSQIKDKASIVFDRNQPIVTNEWLNTIDAAKPTNALTPLPSRQKKAAFQVNWTGADEGSGIGLYTVFVSKNSGFFQPWLSTRDTSGVYPGEPKAKYAFYVVAEDLTGNLADASSNVVTTVRPESSRMALWVLIAFIVVAVIAACLIRRL